MRSLLCLSIVLLVFALPAEAADTVIPSDRVTTRVIVRGLPSSSSARIGELPPGDSADLIASVPDWHRIRLANGTEGFVSKAWTRVLPDAGSPTFQVHFLDVGTGDATIIDIGTEEIVIDGGISTAILHDYAARTGIIDGDIELVVVTHGDSDHWAGLPRLLGFDDRATQPHRVLEFWEPGYNRNCNPLASYDQFISDVRSVPGVRFLRPLQNTHLPATLTKVLETVTLPSISAATIQVLHTESDPTLLGGDCAYRINNASIVLKIEIAGFRFLFTGDANGKEREETGPGTPGHVEAKLLRLEEMHPGILKADVLKVPHHGSETASTQAFIGAVNPDFAIISASTRNQLPRASVIGRYEADGLRVILRTDDHTEPDIDHIICFEDGQGKLDCNYLSAVGE